MNRKSQSGCAVCGRSDSDQEEREDHHLARAVNSSRLIATACKGKCHTILDRLLDQAAVSPKHGDGRSEAQRQWGAVRGLTDFYALSLRTCDRESMLAVIFERIGTAYGLELARLHHHGGASDRLGPDPIRNAASQAKLPRRTRGRLTGSDRLTRVLGLAAAIAADYLDRGEQAKTLRLLGRLAGRLASNDKALATVGRRPRCSELSHAAARMRDRLAGFAIALLTWTLEPSPVSEDDLRAAGASVATDLYHGLCLLDALADARDGQAIDAAVTAFLDAAPGGKSRAP